MSGILKYNTEKLNGDIDKIENAIQLILKDSESMNTEMKALSAMWEGEAKNAFISQFNRDYMALHIFAGDIREVKEHMEFARKEYDQCEMKIYENMKEHL